MSIKVAHDFIFLLKILHTVHWNCYQINHSVLYIFHKKMNTLDQVANIVYSSNFPPSPHPYKWQKRWFLKYWSYYNWAEQETVPNTNQKFWNKNQKDKNQTRSTCWGKKNKQTLVQDKATTERNGYTMLQVPTQCTQEATMNGQK